MTLPMQLPDRLAVPREAQPISPATSHFGHPFVHDGNGDVPSFVLNARQTTEEFPESATAWARLAQATQAAGHADDALPAARRAFELGLDQGSVPSIYAAMIVLASAGGRGDLADLISDSRFSALPTDLRSRAALEVGDFTTALELLPDDSSAEGLAIRAWILLQQGNFRAAVGWLRRADRLEPLGPAALTNLGYAHAALGNLKKAIAATRRAAILSPGHREVGFNLAGYYRALGDHGSALDVLRSMQRSERPDFELAPLIADVYADMGDAEEAWRVLQRVRTSQEWATADVLRRSELEANLAFLRWMTNREKIATARKAVLRALEGCDFASVAIASMLPNLMPDVAQASAFNQVIDKLSERHPESTLLGLRLHAAVLGRDAEAAVLLSQQWAVTDVLNPTAASAAVLLLANIAGRYEEAAELGLAAVPRWPASLSLINNTAYALVLAGRPEEARKLLGPVSSYVGNDVILTATAALIDIQLGFLDEGLTGYKRARELAVSVRKDSGTAMLVDANLALALKLVEHPDADASVTRLREAEVSRLWALRADYWITNYRLRRELGLELSAPSASSS